MASSSHDCIKQRRLSFTDSHFLFIPTFPGIFLIHTIKNLGSTGFACLIVPCKPCPAFRAPPPLILFPHPVFNSLFSNHIKIGYNRGVMGIFVIIKIRQHITWIFFTKRAGFETTFQNTMFKETITTPFLYCFGYATLAGFHGTCITV